MGGRGFIWKKTGIMQPSDFLNNEEFQMEKTTLNLIKSSILKHGYNRS